MHYSQAAKNIRMQPMDELFFYHAIKGHNEDGIKKAEPALCGGSAFTDV